MSSSERYMQRGVSASKEDVHNAISKIDKGVFDLVLWRNSDKRIRFIEVKCPHWDRQTPEQISFSEVVRERGIKTEVVEWEFDSEPISVL